MIFRSRLKANRVLRSSSGFASGVSVAAVGSRDSGTPQTETSRLERDIAIGSSAQAVFHMKSIWISQCL